MFGWVIIARNRLFLPKLVLANDPADPDRPNFSPGPGLILSARLTGPRIIVGDRPGRTNRPRREYRNDSANKLSRPGRQTTFKYYIIKFYNFLTRLNEGINYIKLQYQQLTLIS